MSEQIKTGDVIRFTYTGNRYKVLITPSWIHLETIGKTIGMAAGKMSLEELRDMMDDGVIELEESDD